MRNCDARMTGEVDKRFHGQRRNWSVIPKIQSVMAVLVSLYAICSGTVPTLRAAPQQDASGNNSGRLLRAPAITAKPERVTLVNGSGSTEIEWDTGIGSMGFVFLTEDGGKPVAFASGSRGTQVAPWIGNHRYVFELYGDDRRQTLLAKIAVSGAAESVSSGHNPSWQAVARWVLIIVVLPPDPTRTEALPEARVVPPLRYSTLI